tara:strand:- start:3711 stop:5048 length:1338 start_codon:yes stop_codon:yes gene_type:complete
MTQFDSKTVWGSILHIGAGDCPELDAYQSTRAERIILVEPEPDRAASLERRCAGDARVAVITAALAGENGEAELNIFNIRSVDGLRKPEGLEEIYPGLRLREQIVVPAISPAKLFEASGDLPSPTLVILQTPGMEADILEAWQASGKLAQVDRLHLHCSAAKAFEGGTDAAALRSLLAKFAFEEVSADFSDPDWPVIVVQQNRMRQEVETQRAEIAALTNALKKAENANAALKSNSVAREARFNELREQLSQAESTAKTAADSAAQTLETRDARIGQLETELAARDAAAAAATETIAAKDERLQQLEAQVQELRSAHTEAQAKLDSAGTAAAKAAEAAKAEIEVKSTELKAKSTELVTARSDLAVALRTQAILQTDLRDLQARYQESSTTRQQQEDLLRKLTPRLQEAARQIQEMSALQSEEPQGLSHAPPQKPRGRRPKALPGK